MAAMVLPQRCMPLRSPRCSPSLRVALLSLSFLALSPSPDAPRAQTPLDDALWFTDTLRTQVIAVDRFGRVRRRAFLRGQPFRHPNGDLWLGSGPNLEVYDPDWRFRTSASVGIIGDVAFDLAGNAIGTHYIASELQRVDALGRILSPVRLPGAPRHVAIGADGLIWVAQENVPGAFLSSVHPTTLAVRTVTLPASIGRIVALESELRGRGSSQLWLLGDASDELLEVAPDGSIASTTRLGTGAGSFTGLAIGSRGDLWIASSTRLLRFTRTTGAIDVIANGTFSGVTLDALGTPWAFEHGILVRVDVPRRRLEYLTATQYRFGTRLEDAGGHRALANLRAFDDSDGDGLDNAIESQLGTNPVDELSNLHFDLSTARLLYAPRHTISFDVRGPVGSAALLLAGDWLAGQPPIAGILGTPRLQLPSLLPIALPVAVPGSVPIVVPDSRFFFDVRLCAQPVLLGPAPRFGNHTCVRIDAPMPRLLVEDFTSDAMLDRAASSGTWSGGLGVPGRIGGTGTHGSFDHRLGRDLGNGVWEWNTSDTTIPATHSERGQEIRVTDGRFDFTDLVIPAGVTVRFVGAAPAIVRVRGTVRIDGVLDAGGTAVEPSHNGRNSQPGPPFVPGPGQRGSNGGPGGGRGGDGAFACDGSGTPQQPRYNDFHGFDGEDAQLPAGHAYAGRTAGTRGHGARLFPAHGDSAQLVFRWLQGTYVGSTAAGGGGGSATLPGTGGFALEGLSTGADPMRNTRPDELGPPTASSPWFSILPQPIGVAAIDHFVFGGAGGGGGASHPPAATPSEQLRWWSGAAGAGGGGGLALRAGHDVVVGATGRIAARGGEGAQTADAFQVGIRGIPAPGGGGAGGGLLVQIGGAASLGGEIDVRGGGGSRAELDGFFRLRSYGGDGGAGFYRVEVPQADPPVSLVGTAFPAPNANNIGTLVDRDTRVAFRSRFYSTSVGYSVEHLSYRLVARIGGVQVIYSDDPRNFRPADQPGAAIQVLVQGRDATNRRGPWRDYCSADAGPSINRDHAVALRFLIVFDRSVQRDVVVERFEVEYR